MVKSDALKLIYLLEETCKKAGAWCIIYLENKPDLKSAKLEITIKVD